MITALEIGNFKVIKELLMELGRITVLVGPNGSGKSSVIQALLVLKQSLGSQGAIQLNGKNISLGDFKEVVHLHRLTSNIAISLGGQIDKTKFRYDVIFDASGLLNHRGEVVNRQHLIGEWDRSLAGKIEPEFFQDVEDQTVRISFGTSPRIGEPVDTTGGSMGSTDEGRRRYESLRRDFKSLTSTIRNAISNIHVVPGIRGIDKPDVPLLETPKDDFATSEGTSMQASSLISTIGYEPDISEKASEWIEELDKPRTRLRHRLVPGRKNTLDIVRPSVTTNIINEGLGLNQLLFPLSVLARATPQSLIAIEEPEIHLHPKAQSDLVDLFVDVSKKENKQLLITTHSEHILFRFLTNVAKGKLSPSELAIYYFEKKRNATEATRKKVDKNGNIDGGLPGFFEEDLRTFKEYLDALTKKASA